MSLNDPPTSEAADSYRSEEANDGHDFATFKELLTHLGFSPDETPAPGEVQERAQTWTAHIMSSMPDGASRRALLQKLEAVLTEHREDPPREEAGPAAQAALTATQASGAGDNRTPSVSTPSPVAQPTAIPAATRDTSPSACPVATATAAATVPPAAKPPAAPPKSVDAPAKRTGDNNPDSNREIEHRISPKIITVLIHPLVAFLRFFGISTALVFLLLLLAPATLQEYMVWSILAVSAAAFLLNRQLGQALANTPEYASHRRHLSSLYVSGIAVGAVAIALSAICMGGDAMYARFSPRTDRQGRPDDIVPPVPPEKDKPWFPARTAEASLTSSEVESFMKAWEAAQNNGSYNDYAVLYSADFTGIKRTAQGAVRKYTRDAWIADWEALLKKQTPVLVRTEEITIDLGGRTAEIQMTQYYRAGNYAEKGKKIIKCRRSGSAILIFSEEMKTCEPWEETLGGTTFQENKGRITPVTLDGMRNES